MSTISLKRIYKSYGSAQNETHVLNGVSLEIDAGEFVAITGPSGSGKTTLMNILGLLDVATTGEYHLGSVDTSQLSSRKAAKVRRQSIGFIFQNFNLLPRQHVIENVTLPMIYQRIPRIVREKRAYQLLEQVGLTDRGYYLPNQLSGGQKQRVAIARALANNPKLILADEPTGNLDSKTGDQIIDLLKELNNLGHTVIVVTHDESIAERADRVIHIVDGLIESDEANSTVPTETMTPEQSDQANIEEVINLNITEINIDEPIILDDHELVEEALSVGEISSSDEKLDSKPIHVIKVNDETEATKPKSTKSSRDKKYHRTRTTRSVRRPKK